MLPVSLARLAYWFRLSEHDSKLAQILQVQPDADSVQRRLTNIGAHVQNASVLRFSFIRSLSSGEIGIFSSSVRLLIGHLIYL